jgi:flagellar basal body-associated protein FliL
MELKNKLIIIIIILALALVAVVGYFMFFQSTNTADIKGDAELKVTVVSSGGSPVAGLEIDLGAKSGPPPQGGVAITDQAGVASFSVKPGKYAIYFNTAAFPGNLVVPRETPFEVVAGKSNEAKIILQEK